MKIVIALLCSLCFYSTSMAFEEEMIAVDAEHADYDGKKITLDGNVVVQHNLGTLSANQIILESISETEKTQFSLIFMERDVKLAFHDGGQLFCSKAKIDYRELSGWFSGSSEQEFVVYKENTRTKKNEIIPVLLKSHLMTINLAKSNSKSVKSSRDSINDIIAEEKVTVSYNDDFLASSDQATYHRDVTSSEGNSNRALTGLVTLRAAGRGQFCHITNREGDKVRASQIGIDTVKRQITLAQPVGSLHGKDQQHNINFTADVLVWDDISGILTLRNGVEVNQRGIGKLKTPLELRVHQNFVNGHKEFTKIETDADTILSYQDGNSEMTHTLSCYGPVKVDHQKMETRLLSPEETNGEVLEEHQICFQDAKGQIFSDRALLKYEYVDRQVVPKQLILVGNVRIFNLLRVNLEDHAIIKQYALADRVDYLFHSKEMTFKSAPGHRVLFFSKESNLEISAPVLKIVRDFSTKKDTIQGVGDVRFSFIDYEFEQLREKFSLEKREPAVEEVVEQPLITESSL